MTLRLLRIWFRPFAFVVVLALLAGHVTGWHEVSVLDKLEWLSYDMRLKLLAPQEPDPRIVIVDVDEASLQEPQQGGQGRWPWPRNRLAELVRRLVDDHQVSLIAADFIFSEQDNSSGLPLLQELADTALKDNHQYRAVLERLKPLLDYDQLFAQQMARLPVVLGAAFHHQQVQAPSPPPLGIDPRSLQKEPLPVHAYTGMAAPLPLFQARAAAIGHLNPIRDPDGITRRIPMLVSYGASLYPSLSLATASVVAQGDGVQALRSDDGLDGDRIAALVVGGLQVPVDKHIRTLVPFRAGQHSFQYVSATDVLKGQAPTHLLHQRIVLLGTSAAGLTDYVSTPLGTTMPGVEVHAQMLSGLLDERVLSLPAYSEGVGLLLLLGLALVMALAGYFLRPLPLMSVTLLLLLGLVGANAWIWLSWHLVLPLATPLLCVVAFYLIEVSQGYLVESRSRRQLAVQVTRDALTGLKSRRELDARLADAAKLARGSGQHYSILFLDLDHFKQVNDGHGHAAGDAVLQKLGQVLLENSRASDVVARYGGEEFVILLPDTTDSKVAVKVAEKIRQAVEATAFPTVGYLTISIGVACADAKDASSSSVLKRADEAVYVAKSTGRNKVYFKDSV